MSLPNLGALHVVAAQCVRCSAEVSRAVGFDGQRENWREFVLCADCRDGDDAETVWRKTLDDAAAARLRTRIRSFDAAAGDENASLDDHGVQDTKWAAAAREAIDSCTTAADRPVRAGLMLVGPTGIGKSWAAFAACNAIAARTGADSVRFASEEELLGAEVAPWELKEHLSKWMSGASAVFVDDIGVATRGTDQIQAGWKQLCGLIAAHPSPILFLGTTNRQGWDGQAGIGAWVGAQAASRLRQWTTDCTTGWVDRRTNDIHKQWHKQLTGGVSDA
jgi:DNA replication protein DnaC